MRNFFLRKSVALLVTLLIAAGSPAGVAAEATYEERMDKARELRTSGKQAAADKIYTQILIENPKDVDALVGRGFARMREKKLYEGAIDDLTEAINLSPEYVDAYFGLSLIYKRQRRWIASQQVLEECARSCGEDNGTKRYLAELSWEAGHFPLARRLDLQTPPEKGRKILEYKNEFYPYYSYSWTEKRPDWYETGFTFARRERPDVSWHIQYANFGRNDAHDSQIGAGISLRPTHYLSLNYQFYQSFRHEFLAQQKHRPSMTVSLPTGTAFSAGINFDRYDNGWAEIARFQAQQYFGPLFGQYTLLTGDDNFGRGVITHVFEVGLEFEGKLRGLAGYSRGAETIDPGGGTFFSDDQVETIFFSLKYFVTPSWGIILGSLIEYRDHEHYRDGGAATLFVRF